MNIALVNRELLHSWQTQQTGAALQRVRFRSSIDCSAAPMLLAETTHVC